MGKPTVFEDLDLALQEGTHKGRIAPLTLEYGATSAVTYDIEDYLNLDNEVLKKYTDLGKLRIVKAMGHEAVGGAPHLHGESPLFYGLWMAESILWAMHSQRPVSGA